MTTIVFKDGHLAADTLAVTGNSVTYLIPHKKISLSTDKRIAYGISGMVIEPEWVPDLERALLAFVMEHRNAKSFKAPMPKELVDLIEHRDFILMTKDQVYTKYDGTSPDGSRFMSRLLPGEHASVGTGKLYATMACLYGHTARGAVQFAMENDCFTYPGDIDTIKQTTLKPLPKEVK